MTETVAPAIDGLAYVKKLGSGGFADVFLYNEANPERAVAVKVLRDGGLSPTTIRKFTAEANAMAKLEHSFIVPVYSTGMTRDGRPYIKMRYYPRPSLAERARRERFSVPETLRLGIQLGSAVETAHRAGLLHRDIKPANVLTNVNGSPGLTDFGIAAQVTDEDDPETGVSVPWSPPETLYGTGPATVRSDVYSLAATLWHLLVGRSPFEIPGGDNTAFAMMKRVRDVPPPSTGRAEVPTSLDRLLKASMSKEPAARPSSVHEFIGALQAIEQERRLPRTEPELGEGAPTQYSAAPPPLADATIARTPRLDYQPADADGVTRRRGEAQQVVVGFRDAVDGATVVRTSPQQDLPVGWDATPRKPRRVGVLALAIVLLAAALGVGVVLTAGQRGARPTATPTISQAPPDLTDRVPPGVPTISATRASGHVTFTWRYTSSLPDDQVEWRVQGTTTNKITGPDGSASVPAPATGDACIEVRVTRIDGSSQGGQWTSKCG